MLSTSYSGLVSDGVEAFANASVPDPPPIVPIGVPQPPPIMPVFSDFYYDATNTRTSCPTTSGHGIQVSITIQVPPDPILPSPPPIMPGLLTATEGQNNWSNILTWFSTVAATGTTPGSMTFTGFVSGFHSDFVAVDLHPLAAGGTCAGGPGHPVLQPINADGTSVFKHGSTVPVKFRVCFAGDPNTSVGPSLLSPVVTGFKLVQVVSGITANGQHQLQGTLGREYVCVCDGACLSGRRLRTEQLMRLHHALAHQAA